MKNLMAFIALALLLGCGEIRLENPIVETVEQVSEPVAEKQKSNPPVANTMTCVGRTILSPDARQEVYGRMNAFVAHVLVQEGQEVKRGQVLMSLESPDFARIQKDYLMAKSEYEYQKKTFDRSKILADQESISPQAFDEIIRNHDTTHNLYKGLGAELQSIGFSLDEIDENNVQSILQVRSPVSGQIDHVNVVNGTRIDNEHLLVSIWETNGLMIELNMLAEDAITISTGDKFSFTLPGRNYKFAGEIKYKSMVVNDINHTVSLYASIQESQEEMAAGESVFAQFLPIK